MSNPHVEALSYTPITSQSSSHPSSLEFDDLAIQISMATVALKGVRSGEPHVADKRLPSSLTVMQHVITLLTTGTSKNLSRLEEDARASRVIAATGGVNRSGGLEGLVLAVKNTRFWSEQPDAKSEISVGPLQSQLTGQEILAEWRTRPHDQHFQDVFTVIRDFQSSALPDTGVNVARFCWHYLSHGYPKIASRMLNLYRKQVWGRHPIAVLESRLESGEPFTQSEPWTIHVNGDITLEKLQEYGVPRPSEKLDAATYTVTAEEVPKWIKAFTSTYRELEKLFLIGQSPFSEKSTFKDPPAQSDIAAAMLGIECLRGFLHSNFLKVLFEDKALSIDLATKEPADPDILVSSAISTPLHLGILSWLSNPAI
ncbi:hypothetical protein FA95DRAFT_1614093 [Auriscalpium vulgare]|uniref:Uncharacterized protein n=2 Tax=Auriscalpium vulgare TaxID=40419 RepID=A0ACB8R0D5_9AGAM|nr:hypothetical protein FA95DRAFT_1614122 [Auriscalpium vulgare]KAI0037556.1 hypothetical protein FA95DRAFT_1614093 [Auriscalpium vulgare]